MRRAGGGGGCWSLTAESAPPQPCSWTPTVMCFSICQTCQAPPPHPFPSPPPPLTPHLVRVSSHSTTKRQRLISTGFCQVWTEKKRRKEEESEHFGAWRGCLTMASRDAKRNTSPRAPTPRHPPPHTPHTHTHTHTTCPNAVYWPGVGGNWWESRVIPLWIQTKRRAITVSEMD